MSEAVPSNQPDLSSCHPSQSWEDLDAGRVQTALGALLSVVALAACGSVEEAMFRLRNPSRDN